MTQMIVDTANHLAGYAAKAARVKVVAAYPITPQTTVVEKIADFVENGEMEAEYIRVESEHSAMVACITELWGRRGAFGLISAIRSLKGTQVGFNSTVLTTRRSLTQ
jgi:2-oxoisovalerate ferredoxin oxidoreductase alpha subunit